MINDILLALANLLTSALTAITGVGGGMILIGLMPFFMPAAAVVPVHGVTQFVSNASRAWFGRKDVALEHFWSFLFGSIGGLVVFGILIRFVQLELVPLFIGIYILLITWSDKFNQLIRKFEKFWLVGFIQTGLGVFVGTPGPLNIAVLNKHYDDNHVVVSTGALMMAVVHFAKLIVYVSVGFAFADYWQLLVMMIVMATLGSWVGTKLRHKIKMSWLKTILPYILTLLAIKLIIGILLKFGIFEKLFTLF
ncbi:sulfite exporter TauE/SafE family protein [Faucicola mancuniensis]|uniref:sulfite exporter TauE/SafE family protein n=1 Tax=Faucicola mancuniensis TaxID=1309795 RepID=UPI0039777625